MNFEFRNNTRDLVLGEDVPVFIKDYEKNESILNTLSRNQAVIAGYIMWNLIRSGTLEDGLFQFDTVKPEYERDSSFGRIMVKLGLTSDCSSPETYEVAFDRLLETKDPAHLQDKCRVMVAECLMKISGALACNYKLKIIPKTVAASC